MTPQELKNSIIKLALEGKLVKASDSSGIDLYNKIVDHKKELKIASKKHLDSNSESYPFDIPENWKWCRFGEVVNYRMGKTPPRAESEWWTNDIPWISIADMIENGYVSNTKEKVSNNALRIKFGGNISPKGTLIMSFKLTVGRVSILDIDAVHNEAIISIFPYVDESNTFRNYLFYVLPFLSQFGETKGAIKGNTLNDTSLCNLPIPLPSFEEQKRIVAKIEELLPLVDRYERAWNKLEQFNKKFPVDMEKAILKLAMQGKLTEQLHTDSSVDKLLDSINIAKKNYCLKYNKKFKSIEYSGEYETLDEIPDNWRIVSLSDLCLEIGDIDHNMPKSVTEGIPFISAKDILDNNSISFEDIKYISKVDYERLSRKMKPQTNDIIFSRIGTLGKVGYVTGNVTFLPSYSCCMIRNAGLNLKYLGFCLQGPEMQKRIKDAKTGIGVPDLGMAMIRSFAIPVPPIEEQERIVAKLEELLPLCRKLIK